MATYDLSAKIHIHSNTFTKMETKVADYVLNNPNKILYMSITELADACGVGDTTVFRFCRTLKLNGYQDFKVMLAQSIAANHSDSQIATGGEVEPSDTIADVCRKVLSLNLSALTTTCNLLREADIDRAVTILCAARQIHFFGIGSSGMAAMDAQGKFLRVMSNVTCILDAHMQSMTAALMNEQDLAIVYSYSGSSKDIIDIIQTAKANRAKTICITRFAKSPITAYADVVLLCGGNEGPMQGGSLCTKITQLFVTDILYNEYFRRNFGECSLNKEKTTTAISNKLL